MPRYLQKMSKVPQVSDFTMHVNMDGIDDVKSYYVHKVVLRDASPFFNDLLTAFPDMEEFTIPIIPMIYSNIQKDDYAHAQILDEIESILGHCYGLHDVEYYKIEKKYYTDVVLKYQFKEYAYDLLQHCICNDKVTISHVILLDRLCCLALSETIFESTDDKVMELKQYMCANIRDTYSSGGYDESEFTSIIEMFNYATMCMLIHDDGQSCMDGDFAMVKQWIASTASTASTASPTSTTRKNEEIMELVKKLNIGRMSAYSRKMLFEFATETSRDMRDHVFSEFELISNSDYNYDVDRNVCWVK
jgi:hypothetical protein